MRATRTWVLGGVAAAGVAVAVGGALWKMGGDPDAPPAVASTAPVPLDSPASTPMEAAPAPVEAPATAAPVAGGDAPAQVDTPPAGVVSESAPAEAPMPAEAPAPTRDTPPDGAPDAPGGADGAVIYPGEEEIFPPAPVETPEFVEGTGSFAPVASVPLASAPVEDEAGLAELPAGPSADAIEAFARVSRAVFARNASYGAAIARAQEAGDTARADALRAEMAGEAQAAIARDFPGGVAAYISLAQEVRANSALEAEVAGLMETLP